MPTLNDNETRHRFCHATESGRALELLLAEENAERAAQIRELTYPIVDFGRFWRAAEGQNPYFRTDETVGVHQMIRWVASTIPSLACLLLLVDRSLFWFLPLTLVVFLIIFFITPHVTVGVEWFRRRDQRKQAREHISRQRYKPALENRIEAHIQRHRKTLLGDGPLDTDSEFGRLFTLLEDPHSNRRGPNTQPAPQELSGYRVSTDAKESFADLLASIQDAPTARSALLRYRDMRTQTYDRLLEQGKRAAEHYEAIDRLDVSIEQDPNPTALAIAPELRKRHKHVAQEKLTVIEEALHDIEQEHAKLRDAVHRTLRDALSFSDNDSAASSEPDRRRIAPEALASAAPAQHEVAAHEHAALTKRRG